MASPLLPTPKRRTRMYWFTMCALVGPVWLLTPLSWLALAWGLTAAAHLGEFHWPAHGSWAMTWASIGVGWATLEV